MRVILLLIIFYIFLFGETRTHVYEANYPCRISPASCEPCADIYFLYGHSDYSSCSSSIVGGSLGTRDYGIYTETINNCTLTETWADGVYGRFSCDVTISCEGVFDSSNNCVICPMGTQYNPDSDTCESICSSDHIYDSTNNICLCPDGQVEDINGNCVVEDCNILYSQKKSECDSLGKLLNGDCVFNEGQLISNTLYCADPPVASCDEIQKAFIQYPPDCGGGVPVSSCNDNNGDPIVEFYCKVSPDTQVGGNTALSTQIDNLNIDMNNNFDSLNSKIDSLPDNTQKLNDIESKIDNIKDPTTQLNDIQNDLSTLDTSLSSKIDNINVPNYSTELTNLSTQNTAIQSSQIGINSKLDTLQTNINSLNLDSSSINTNIDSINTNISNLETNIQNSIDNLDSENSNIVRTLRDVQNTLTDSKIAHCTTLDGLLGVIVNDICVPYANVKDDIIVCPDNAPVHPDFGCNRRCSDVGWFDAGNGNCIKSIYYNCDEIKFKCVSYCYDLGMEFDIGSFECINSYYDCGCQIPEYPTPTPTLTPTPTPDIYCKTTSGLAGVIVNGECVAMSSTPEPTPSPTSTPDLYCKTTSGLAGVIVNGECVAMSLISESIPIPTITISVNTTSTGITNSDLDDLGTSIGSDLDDLSSDLTSGNSCACPPTCSKFYNSSTDIWKCNCNGSIKECGETLSFNDEDLNDIDNVEEDTEGLDTLQSYVTSNEFNNYTNKFKIEDISCPPWDESEVSFEISLDIPFIDYHISENKSFATAETMDSLPYGIIVKILYFLVGLRLFIGFIRS